MPGWPNGVPKTLNAEQRVERARNAALSRTTVDHHLAALAGKPLTAEQRATLADLLLNNPTTENAAGAR